jgi:DNA invertase Pin-like site-specific DNA recombinase
MEGKFVAYYRVSTARQGRSGLGLNAQKEAVANYLNGGRWSLAGEFVEVESGADNGRPQLAEAIKAAKRARASLIVAKLDRLARDVRFLLEVVDSGVRLRFVDLPEVEIEGAAGRLMLTVMGAVAEFERRRLSERTKAALAAKRARGERLGREENFEAHLAKRRQRIATFDRRVRRTFEALRGAGTTQRGIVDELNKAGVRTLEGGEWSLVQVQRVIKRLGVA